MHNPYKPWLHEVQEGKIVKQILKQGVVVIINLQIEKSTELEVSSQSKVTIFLTFASVNVPIT